MPEHVLREEETDLTETLGWVTGVLIRRRWWILCAACGITLATIGVLLMMPNMYTSEATLVVLAQQVPQRYVVPNSTADLDSTLQAMKQEVLSRTRLLRMINDFGLYPKKRKRLAPEQLVSLMLNDIDITPLGERPQERNFDAFRISYTTDNALLAQQVTSTLTSLFINEHLRTQEEQSTNTTKFLHEQVAEKKAKLEDQERRLSEFKIQHMGELPEQEQGNLGILQGLQNQLQNTVTSLDHAQQQRMYLQSLLESHRRPAPAAGGTTMPVVAERNIPLTPLQTAQNQLSLLESERAQLYAKGRTKDHPDVTAINREITRAQELVKRLKAETPLEPEHVAGISAPAPPPTVTDDPAVAQLRSQVESNRMEIENLTKEENRLKTTINQYEGRLNQTPMREQQQAGIVRETEALRQEYSELQKKEEESQLATNLEKQQGGQQFRPVDTASLPLVPSRPKRLKLSMTGAALGLALGIALAFVMELRDTSFRSEKELKKRVTAPFVLEVPVLQTRGEERRLKLRYMLEWVAASGMAFVVLIAEYYVFKHG